MKRQLIYFVAFGLIATLLLGACRPIAGESDAPAGDAAEPTSAQVTPAPAETPASETASDTTEPATAAEEMPSVEELMAQIPTPGPDAVIPTPAAFQPEEMAVRGDPNAPITVVEFSDFQCPYCLSYATETYPRLIKDFVDNGLVRYVFKDFPLEQIHPQAAQAAEAARCAGEQDAYWQMHDALFVNQSRWAGQENPVPVFAELAGELNLDQDALTTCVESGRYQELVQANAMEGQVLGVTGTPTFFVEGYPIVGARPYELFELAFALADAGRLKDAFAQVPTPTPMPVGDIPIEGAPTLGEVDAPVLIIEYSDYQCPYCSRYNAETFGQIKTNYIDTGVVRYVFKDFPLSFHQQAPLAAEAAHCAGDQGAYWEMHDLLFANQSAWSNDGAAEVFYGYAEQLGLDAEAFAACLQSGTHTARVQAGLQEGLSVGVNGTPAFFVGSAFISGAQPYEAFAQAIEAALGQ